MGEGGSGETRRAGWLGGFPRSRPPGRAGARLCDQACAAVMLLRLVETWCEREAGHDGGGSDKGGPAPLSRGRLTGGEGSRRASATLSAGVAGASRRRLWRLSQIQTAICRQIIRGERPPARSGSSPQGALGRPDPPPLQGVLVKGSQSLEMLREPAVDQHQRRLDGGEHGPIAALKPDACLWAA